MGVPLVMLSDEHITIHVDGFVDAAGGPQTVDSVAWEIDDPTAATVDVTNEGMDVDVRAVDMIAGAAAKTTVVRMRVTEGGVADAIMDTHDTMVSPPASPLATRANVTVSAAMKK